MNKFGITKNITYFCGIIFIIKINYKNTTDGN